MGLVAAIASSSSGEDVRWIGRSGGFWSNPANWEGTKTPTSADAAIFDLDAEYSIVVDTNTVISDLIIERGVVTFEGGTLSPTENTAVRAGGQLISDCMEEGGCTIDVVQDSGIDIEPGGSIHLNQFGFTDAATINAFHWNVTKIVQFSVSGTFQTPDYLFANDIHAPVIGDSFVLVQAALVEGVFAKQSFLSDGAFSWDVVYQPTQIVVRYVRTGDLDEDGFIDGADLAMLLAGWGGSHHIPDIDNDGVVDGVDLSILLSAWTME